MAESAKTNPENPGRTWTQNATRTAILEAARRLAAREGVENVTLNKVAEEAGFPPATVYGQFVSKEDLHMAVVADDLAGVAQAMRGDESEMAPEMDETSDEAVLVKIEQAIGFKSRLPHSGGEDEDDIGEIEEIPAAFGEDEIENSAQTANDKSGERAPKYSHWRRGRRSTDKGNVRVPAGSERDSSISQGDARAMQATIAKLQESVARLESRPVDAWLERRLRVFERTLADIETRMEKTERDSSTALSTVSEGFKALEQRFSETLAEMTRHSTDSEQRQHTMTADFKMYVQDLSGRLGALETSLSRMFDEPREVRHQPMPVPPDPYAGLDEPASEPAKGVEMIEEPPMELAPEQIAKPKVESEGKPQDKAKPENYLSAARRAAKAAAAQTETARPRPVASFGALSIFSGKKQVSRRSLYLVAGILALAVMIVAANIVLKSHVSGPAMAATSPAAAKGISADERVVQLAKAGNPKAELIAGLKFLNGDGMAVDVPSATHWLKAAAEGKEPVAEYWLGTLYERGLGVSVDKAKAMMWYERAAQAGNAKAMYRLGVAEVAGWNGDANYVEAAKWFTKAANLGLLDAQFNLAVLYERGAGVPESRINAFKWYAIAATQGDAESKSRIDSLASQMSADDVAKAQAEAVQFHPATPNPAVNVEPTVTQVAALK